MTSAREFQVIQVKVSLYALYKNRAVHKYKKDIRISIIEPLWHIKAQDKTPNHPFNHLPAEKKRAPSTRYK